MADQKILGAILFEDFELLDLYGPLEMFGNIGPELKIITIAEATGPVKSAQGPSTVAEYSFADAPKVDMMLIPGGFGTFAEAENPVMLEFVQKSGPKSEALMSVCSGSGVLAHAGLLDGRKATSNKLFFNAITEHASNVEWLEDARWVEDGHIFTSSGVSAGTDMSLAVIAKHYGQEKAEQIAVMTEYEWQSDSTADGFTQYLNQGDLSEYLELLGKT